MVMVTLKSLDQSPGLFEGLVNVVMSTTKYTYL